MRPLARSRVEFGVRGQSQIVIGVLVAVAAVIERSPRQVVAIALGAVIYGGLMYLVLYRRRIREILDDPPAAVSAQRESEQATRLRTVKAEGLPLLVALLVIGIVFRGFAIVSGIAIGNGVAMIILATTVQRWEAAHDLMLLREPRFRWKGTGGRRRGGGVLDPRDYYSASTRDDR